MNEPDAVVEFLSRDERVRVLCQEPLPPEYSYASLSTMLLDAIFSIGVRYGQVKAVIARHAKCQQYDPWQFSDVDPYPLPKLILEGRQGTAEEFADKLGNRCLTSTRSGILKAEAVLLAAEALVQHGIMDLPSWRSHSDNLEALKAAERDFRAIKGQSTGISWRYLSMLAGDDNNVKPDRMIIREAGELLLTAAAALRGIHGYPSTLTARQLDAAVWNVARSFGRKQMIGSA
jgi:hypothetical protein